jgi:hypothetical protein
MEKKKAGAIAEYQWKTTSNESRGKLRTIAENFNFTKPRNSITFVRDCTGNFLYVRADLYLFSAETVRRVTYVVVIQANAKLCSFRGKLKTAASRRIWAIKSTNACSSISLSLSLSLSCSFHSSAMAGVAYYYLCLYTYEEPWEINLAPFQR